jgi:hypothetical protein
MVSAYQQFVKEHMGEFKHLPAKERMKAVAQLYKKGSEAPAKKGRGRPKKGGAIMTGAGVNEDDEMMNNLFSDNVGGSLKKTRGRPKKGGAMVESPLMSGDKDIKMKGGIMTGAGFSESDMPDFLKSFVSMFDLKGRSHL